MRNTVIRHNGLSSGRSLPGRILCLVICLLLTAGLAGCGNKEGSEKTDGQTRTAETSLAAAETETQEETTTEEETISLYTEDGRRKVWVRADSSVNIRQKPDKESAVVGEAEPRDQLTLVSGQKEKGFYEVHFTNKDGEEETGYIVARYLDLDAPDVNPAVVLDVPLYFQTDEKWCDITLGSSRRTMEAIGCTTCCLAMSESYLTGEHVTPDMMEERLYYTSKGELGWPKTYYWSRNGSYMLEIMFNRLHNGVPVLLGCMKPNGRPHWILVTGYTGDGEKELKASDFVINDPLPYGRTTLDEYLEVYPRFYKMTYYVGDRALIWGTDESKAAAREAKQESKAAAKASKAAEEASKKASEEASKKAAEESKKAAEASKDAENEAGTGSSTEETPAQESGETSGQGN